MNQKHDLRKQLRAARRNLGTQQQKLNASAVAATIRSMPEYAEAQNVAAYIANDGEIAPSVIVSDAWQQGKRIFLPVLAPGSREMTFRQWTVSTHFTENQYHIPEPESGPEISPRDLDLVLLPLVGFDQHGRRLGMGGGYYDTTFEYVRKDSKGEHSTQLIGLAHECQKADQIPSDPWDIPLAAIVTDSGIYRIPAAD